MKAGGVYIEVRGDSKRLKRDLGKAHGKVAASAKKMEENITRGFKRAAVASGVAISALALGVVAASKRVIALGREFESTMKTVQAWSGATGKDLEALTAIARKMGATTEHTATEAAGALKFLPPFYEQ